MPFPAALTPSPLRGRSNPAGLGAAPFADQANRHREIMIADLISGPLRGQEFRFHLTDPATGRRTVQTIGADAGERLKEPIEAAVAATG